MRTRLLKRTVLLVTTLGMAGSAALAATFSANFNNGQTPAGMTIFDPAKVVASGGVGGTGYLSLTDAIGNQNSGAIIDDFNGGLPIGGFTARMKILIGGGGTQPADGFSVSFGDDLPDGSISEEGAGTGLIVALDTYDNGAGEAPALDIVYGGTQVAHTKFDGVTSVTLPPIIDPATGKAASLQTGTNFVDLLIDLHPNGTLDVVYKGIVVYTNLFIPGYAPKAGRFGLGARTGGALENHWIDDLTITTVAPITTPVSVKEQPKNQTVNERGSVTFSVVPDGAPPFTFQWFKNSVAIANETGATYTITNASFNDNGAKFKVKVTNAGGSADSAEAVLTVNADTIKPTIVGATGSDSFTEVTIVFSEPVTSATAGDKANYGLSGGLTISSATALTATTARLVTSRQTTGTVYTLTVNNIKDTAAAGNVIVANSTKTFTSLAIVRGGLKLEVFNDIAGTPIQGMLDDPKYQANAPDFVGYVSQFTSRLVLPDNESGLATRESYGGRLSGWIVPAETAQYEFFIRSDDASQLFLSPDDNPANAALIAEEIGCCNAFQDPGATQTSAPISLTANRRYYIYALWKEGGGGDYCDVAWRKVGDPAVARALPYIPGSVLETFGIPEVFTPPTVAIASPAAGSTFDVGVPVTLTATASAAPGKTIVKVEYFDQASKVGESSVSPYTVVLSGLSADAHPFTAKATDSAGIFTVSAPVSISVGGLVEKLTLVAIDDKTTWRYDRTGRDLGTAWRANNYDDSAWPQGKTLIADETTTTVEPIRTPINRFNDNNEYVITFYFRTHFNFTGAVTPGVKLQLRHAVDDGAVFYLNGVEIHRFGLADGATYDSTTLFGGHENAYEGPYDISITNLVQGDNVLSAEVHQSSTSSSDIVFGAELLASVPVVPTVKTLLAIDDTTVFRYDRTGRDLGTAWKEKSYDDSTWPQGKTLIADETTTTVEPIRTPISRFNDNNEYVITFYFRTHFNLDVAASAVQKLRLRHAVDDGAIFYINGVEVHRFGLADGAANDFTTLFAGHENAYEGPYDLATTNLVKGDNVFAAEVHQSSTSSSDIVFGAELIATYLGGAGTGTAPPTFTKISRSGADVVFEWTGGGTLQSADSVAGPWNDVSGASTPRTVTPSGPGKFYRVKQ